MNREMEELVDTAETALVWLLVAGVATVVVLALALWLVVRKVKGSRAVSDRTLQAQAATLPRGPRRTLARMRVVLIETRKDLDALSGQLRAVGRGDDLLLSAGRLRTLTEQLDEQLAKLAHASPATLERVLPQMGERVDEVHRLTEHLGDAAAQLAVGSVDLELDMVSREVRRELDLASLHLEAVRELTADERRRHG